MKLKTLQKGNLKNEQLVIYRGHTAKPTEGKSATKGRKPTYYFKLALITSVTSNHVALAPFGPVWDEDEPELSARGDEQHPPADVLDGLPRYLSLTQCDQWLAVPEFEVGDPLIHRCRTARIIVTKTNDLHVSIEYEDEQGGDFYGNLIWMDLTPSLELLHFSTTWPSLT